jgi:hypothetical protein
MNFSRAENSQILTLLAFANFAELAYLSLVHLSMEHS